MPPLGSTWSSSITTSQKSRRNSCFPDPLKSCQQLTDLCCIEQSIRPAWRNVRERRPVQQSSVQQTMLGQVVHNHVHKVDLVRVERLSCQEAVHCLLGSLAVHAHQ